MATYYGNGLLIKRRASQLSRDEIFAEIDALSDDHAEFTLAWHRWPNADPVCPWCSAIDVHRIRTRRRFRCRVCLRDFTTTTKTPFAYHKLSTKQLLMTTKLPTRLRLRSGHWRTSKEARLLDYVTARAGVKQWVYAIKCRSYVKFGTARRMRQRLANIRNANPVDVELRWLAPCVPPYAEENWLRIKFEHLIHRGEWYHWRGEIKEFLDTAQIDRSPYFIAKNVADTVLTEGQKNA